MSASIHPMSLREAGNASDGIADLVRHDRVHASVYTSRELFDLEMERIFGRAWIFMAHESQVPNPGDFVTSWIGQQPVIVVRDRSGAINVLFNRCSHRGSIVCREHQGNASRFICPYHGWSFRNDGSLAGLPYRSAYSEKFLATEELGLARVPRIDSYRGFVFASAAPTGPGLVEFIGPLKDGIDNLLDRSPTGEVIVDAGVHRYQFKGNWKMQMENGLDEYHPPFSHASTVKRSGQQLQRAYGSKGGYTVVGKEEPEAPTAESYYDHGEVHGARHGQAYLTIPDAKRRMELEDPEYRAALDARHGPDKAQAIIDSSNMSNAVFYPSVIMRVSGNMHIRVVRPVSVDETEIYVWPMQVKGLSDRINHGIVRYSNVHVSVSSFVQTDDLEIFERVFEGLQAKSPPWVLLARGLDGEWPGPYPDERVGKATWETGMRAQFRYWKQMMTTA